ncbi:hypothetical protein K3495_g2065 [Podosphaera aphanis]|nr:hypothetical protein K3495_g2065 [Podosphaera aphanis]
MSTPKRLARQLSELYGRAPQEFDPEEDVVIPSEEDPDTEESADELAGTEHYAPVGKSKLARPAVDLGAEYSGSTVRRQALEESSDGAPEAEISGEDSEMDTSETFADPENCDPGSDDEDGDIDSDDALGESDNEKFQSFTFRGSSTPRVVANGDSRRHPAENLPSESEIDMDDGGVPVIENDKSKNSPKGTSSATEDDASASDDESEGSEESDSGSSGDSESNNTRDSAAATRSELQKIMAEDQKLIISNLTEAVKADAIKGQAVMKQRKAFDSLLNVRMTLQKALIASNTMAAMDTTPHDGREVENAPYEAAEEAAIKLWNTLDRLRHDLSKSIAPAAGLKRKRDVDLATPSAALWERMQRYEVAVLNHRQSTLDKWAAKVRGAAVLPVAHKFTPVASHPCITSVLHDKLADPAPLIQRTRVPRSCAPVQREQHVLEDPRIYDDSIFYQMLLKDLVEQRRAESRNTPAVLSDGNPAPWAAIKEAKTRKVVDTRASKGRKMRYTVHEKLQNFMAPEDRSSWEPAAVDRLFSTLLGQKLMLGEEDRKSDEDMHMVDEEDGGLRLFKS